MNPGENQFKRLKLKWVKTRIRKEMEEKKNICVGKEKHLPPVTQSSLKHPGLQNQILTSFIKLINESEELLEVLWLFDKFWSLKWSSLKIIISGHWIFLCNDMLIIFLFLSWQQPLKQIILTDICRQNKNKWMCLWVGGVWRTSGFHSQGKEPLCVLYELQKCPLAVLCPSSHWFWVLWGCWHNGLSVLISFVAGPFVREFYLLWFKPNGGC